MATAFAVFAASSAFAINPRLGVADPSAIAGSESIGPRTFNGTGFEASEGFGLGSLSAVNGWRCFGGANAFPPGGPGPRCSGTLNGSNQFVSADGSPAGVVAKGNGSAQGLFLTQNFNFPGNTNIGAFTPKFKDFLTPTFNVDIRIDDIGGSNYTVTPQTPLQGFSTSRVIFAYTGYIYALDDLDGPGPGTLQFVTIGLFDPFASDWMTFQFDYDYANLSVKYSMGPDKNNLTLLHTGYLYGGTQVEEIVLFSDNFQNTGSGAASGDPRGPGAYIDNIVAKPEPGTLAMLGIGALLALRRRSR